MRLFVAIRIPANRTSELAKVQNALKSAFPLLNPVSKKDFHITLSFLGSRGTQNAGDISSEIEALVGSLPEIKISFGKVEFFPTLNYANVAAISVSGEFIEEADLGEQEAPDELAGLAGKLSTRLKGSYKSPHITLGRFKNGVNASIGRKAVDKANSYMPSQFSAASVELTKSTTVSSGPVYETVNNFSFKS